MSWFTRSREHGETELNLIPLIDIMSVLVSFLLIYSTEVEIVQNTKGVEVPRSTAEAKPTQSVVVMITKDNLFVQGELIANVAEVRTAETPLVEPLRDVLARPMLAGGAAAADPAAGPREITVIADKSLPFEVLKKVMATCTASAYGKISLAVMEKDKPAVAGA
ncbi:MAG TPA: biopolymer transporter ExbD [Steroidobacter sp.]|nr:biopolymer transporter ExbD [Steroidobacter sp.]